MKTALLLFTALLISTARASATTCSEAVAKCRSDSLNKPDIDSKCQAAGSACMKTGIFLGPISGKTWKNLKRQ